MFYMAEAYYGKMYKKTGFTMSVTGFKNEGYREGETEDRARISGTVFFRPQKIKRMKAGIGYEWRSFKKQEILLFGKVIL